MNSDERRAARRRRREAKRAENRRKRLENCTLEQVADFGNMYDAAKLCMRGVRWKTSVQRYETDILVNVSKACRDLREGNDISRSMIKFDTVERGKVRHITAVSVHERVPQKSITKNALIPAITPSLVYSNSANMKGRGNEYAIKLLRKQLADHYREYGPEGYVLQFDFSNYFAQIAHPQLKAQVARYLDDPRLVDLEFRQIDKQGDRGLWLGLEPNQVLAVAFPNRIDHYMIEMMRIRGYGRYMDDGYGIHISKDHLREAARELGRLCCELGITLNPKKTHITKLSRGFVFMKKRFFFTDTGRIVTRPYRPTITRARRRVKKHASMVRDGRMTYEQARLSFVSTRGALTHLDAYETRIRLDALFRAQYAM